MKSTVEFAAPDGSAMWLGGFVPTGGSGMNTEHEVSIPGITDEGMHPIRIRGVNAEGETHVTQAFEFDSTFNYTLHHRPGPRDPFQGDEHATGIALAERILEKTTTRAGYCLVLGAGSPALAHRLARGNSLKVVVIDPDRDRVAAARKALDEAGVYGDRVSVMHAGYDSLPFGPYFANIVVAASMGEPGAAPSVREVYRVLRPYGGVAYVGGATATHATLEAWISDAGL
ncbi:MAG: class I SAM-dependent methyltransferase, partial [Candidatus Poribacteria bacterium]